MKKLFYKFFLAVAVSMAALGQGYAQTHYNNILADYPLYNSLNDTSGHLGPMTINGVSAPSGGQLCIDGVYQHEATTPNIATLDPNNFAFSVDFKAAGFDDQMPVIIAGTGWRWLGIQTDHTGLIGISYNNNLSAYSTKTVVTGVWYHARVMHISNRVVFFLDNQVVMDTVLPALATGNNYNFSTTDFAFGKVFNGCLKNLVIERNPSVAEGCEYDTYVFGTQNLTHTGIYTETLPAVGYTDSTVTLAYIVKYVHYDNRLAYYPLTSDLNEFSGLAGAISCSGAPPSGGMLCLDGTSTNQAITPILDSLHLDDFDVSVDFNMNVLPASYFPVIIGGNSYRWLGITINNNAAAGIIYNNTQMITSTAIVTTGTWYNVRLIHKHGRILMYLDSQLIMDDSIPALSSNYDYNFTTCHWGNLLSFNGCIKNLLVENNPFIVEDCEGVPYTYGTQTVTTSGLYSEAFPSSNGCDSTGVLAYVAWPLPAASITGLDTFYCVYNPSVTFSVSPPGGTINGNGVTGNVFDPSIAGVGNWTVTYAVTGTNGCAGIATVLVNVSTCAGIDVKENDPVRVYPNPAANILNLDFAREDHYILSVSDAMGKEIQRLQYSGGHHIVDLSNYPAGVYAIRIMYGGTIRNVKLIVER